MSEVNSKSEMRRLDIMKTGEIEELRKINKQYKKTLEFYADIKNWDVENGTCHDMVPKGLDNPRKLWSVLDMGERARKALNEE